MSEKKLKSWVKKLENANLPVMGKTVDVLRTAEQFVNAHSSQLTETILQDPNMTASVLKLANSALYSRNKKISTISRAILVLGFEAIRSICVSAMVLEAVGKTSSIHLLQAVAFSFQSAVQAKMFAVEKEDEDPESIYIAALLFNLGEIAFWSSGDSLTIKMSEALDSGMSLKRAQEEILGFSLNQLTLTMTKQWNISDVLQEALLHKDSPDSSSRAVVLSNKLARALPGGWEHPEVKKLIVSASKYAACNVEKLNEILGEAAETSAITLSSMGLKKAAGYILLPPGSKVLGKDNEQNRSLGQYPEPDEKLQMSILRDLSMLAVGEKLDVNVVLQLVLEGVSKGIGMDRALVALILPNKNALIGKYIVQSEPDSFKDKFSFPLKDVKADPLLSSVIQEQKVVCNVKLNDANVAISSPVLVDGLNVKELMVGPLVLKGRCVGIFYADRAPSKRPITGDALESFKFFVSQATLCLRSVG